MNKSVLLKKLIGEGCENELEELLSGKKKKTSGRNRRNVKLGTYFLKQFGENVSGPRVSTARLSVKQQQTDKLLTEAVRDLHSFQTGIVKAQVFTGLMKKKTIIM